MATNFPTSLDAFTNPTAVDTLDSPPHDAQHADANDAIEALQAKVGVDGSAVTGSLDYKVAGLTTDLNAIGTYTDYSSSQTFGGFTKGNGSVISRYTQINKLVHYWGIVTLGSTSSVTAVIDLVPPVAPSAGTVQEFGGNCTFADSAAVFYHGRLVVVAGNYRMTTFSVSGSQIRDASTSSTVPFTWTTGDSFLWNVTYQAA